MEDRQNKRPSWARRKFFINEHFQLHFVAFTAIVALAACVGFYVAAEWFFMRYHDFAVEVGMRPADPFFRVLFNMEMMLTNVFIVTSVCVVIVSVVGGILFSHKVAGPMYRLRQHLESIARGETLQDVTFRKNDYFTDVAAAFNTVMQIIRTRLGSDAPAPVQKNEEMTYETPVEVTKSTEIAEANTAAIDTKSDDFKKAS